MKSFWQRFIEWRFNPPEEAKPIHAIVKLSLDANYKLVRFTSVCGVESTDPEAGTMWWGRTTCKHCLIEGYRNDKVKLQLR